MNKNPYGELIGMFREEGNFNNGSSFFIGSVVSEFPSIKIAASGVVLDKDDLLIDKWLYDSSNSVYTENTTCTTSHRHQVILDKLKVNDKVVLLKIDDKFVLLSKVVTI